MSDTPLNIPNINKRLVDRIAQASMQFDCGAGGDVRSHIAIVGEAPGERETALKVPLIGGSGKLLWDCLRTEKLNRNQVYITNVVKRRLVTAAEQHKNKAPISRHELEHWRHILIEELCALPNVKYVLALGNYALEALTGEVGIQNHRGSVYYVEHRGRKFTVVCTYNPAFIIRTPKAEITFRMDLRKLTKALNGTLHAPAITAHINPTLGQALDYLAYLRATDLPISYDIETMGNETSCVGVANSNTEGMCINFRDGNSHRFIVEDERKLRLAIQETLGAQEARLIAQNNNFDATWLWYKDRIKTTGCWIDTMLGHHLLYPTLPHNLGYLVSQYTDYPYHKDDGKEWRDTGNIDQLWEYNVKDVVTTRIAAFAILQELRDAKLDTFFFQHVMKLQPHLVRMTVGGVKSDAELKTRLTEDLSRDVEQAGNLVNELASIATGIPGRTVNPSSPKQLGDLFFRDLKLVGRGASTDKENRKRMREHPRTSQKSRELLDAIDRYAQEAKFLSTYADAQIDPDGRFRCEYRQTGVQSAPGRLSSAGTLWKSGLNLQNIPERGKPMFIADPGYVFSYFDMAQIEARYVAWLAGIKSWKEQFELARLERGKYDAHRALASDLFKVPYDDVPTADFTADGKPTIRYIAKRCRHGLNYRMAAGRLATTAGLPLSEAETAYHLYHARHPEIREWWDATIREVKTNRELYSPLGRRWILLERLEEDTLDSIVAFRPQSTAGDHVASVIYKCERDPRWPRDARFVLNIHDADIAMHRPEDGEVVRGLMRLYAEAPVFINGEPVIVPADFAVSQPDDMGIHRWSTLKKMKEPPEMLPPP